MVNLDVQRVYSVLISASPKSTTSTGGGPCRSRLSISPAAGTWRYLAVRLHDRAVAALQLYLQVPDAPVRALAATGWAGSNHVCASRGALVEEGQASIIAGRSGRSERSGWDAVVSDEWSRSMANTIRQSFLLAECSTSSTSPVASRLELTGVREARRKSKLESGLGRLKYSCTEGSGWTIRHEHIHIPCDRSYSRLQTKKTLERSSGERSLHGDQTQAR